MFLKKKLDTAKNEIDSLNYQIDQIANLHSTLLQSLNDQQSRRASNDLERMKASAQRSNFNVKAMIQGRFSIFMGLLLCTHII